MIRLSLPRMTRTFNSALPHLWWGLLIFALLLHWIETERRIDRVVAVSSIPTWSVSEPREDALSPTGWEKGQRNLIVAGHHNSSFSWITEAQIVAESGLWRLREIDYDSYPEGREIFRTSLYRWWLVSVGWIRSVFTGEPLGLAIELGTLYADPLLFGVLIISGGLYCVRTLGPLASLGFAVGCLWLFPLSSNFQPGAPDPHSLAWVLAVGSVLPIVSVVSKSKLGERGCIHIMIAGGLGGLGFWNTAETQLSLLLAVAIGGLMWELGAGGESGVKWRCWSISGSVVVLGASLFEFSPNYFFWSLDAVNPLHALIWLGLGELLHAVSVWRLGGIKVLGIKGVVLASLGLVAVLAWPIFGYVSESGSLLASDFYAREIANDPAGGLGANFGVWLGKAGGAAKVSVLFSCLLLIFPLVNWISGKTEPGRRGVNLFLVGAGSLLVLLSFVQIRWFNLYDALALVLLAVVFREGHGNDLISRLKQFGPALLVAPGLLVGIPRSVGAAEGIELTAMEKQALIERDYGYWLRHYNNSDELVLFSTPMFAATSAYYGGFKSVVSGEGNNTKGFETAVRLAAADSLQEVSILLEALKVTHVAIPLWDPMVEHMARIGVGAVGEMPPNVFFLSLRDWDVPYFLKALNYPIPTDATFKGYALPSFSVQAELAPDIALSNLADLFVERGQQREMMGIREVLKEYPRSIYALSSIANIEQALGDPNSKESLAEVIPYLSRRAARRLPLDRRITLAVVLYKGKERDLARNQVEAAMGLVGEESLRRLSPNAVASLMALSGSLGIEFPDSQLRDEALSLVPVGLREQLSK